MPGDQAGCDEAQGEHGDRRVAAFAFVDIVGYSILMAKDEARTHARWMTILNEVIRPQVERHRGRIVKSTGDGILAEFPAAADAVEWACDVQRSVVPDEGDETPSVALRIAVNMGEIFATPDDIYGDSVNLAARLQEYAEPGGIALSEAIYRDVHASIADLVQDLGYLELKHVERPTRAYAIPPFFTGISIPVLQRRAALPSIAILPLQNLGGDRDDDYFGDGIVEDITVSLASLRELLVISRTSALLYHGARPDPRVVGQTLGVRYVLMGSVRRSSRLVRVSTQLFDAETGASIWGDKAEVPIGDLFDVQDDIVRRIVAGIAPQVREAELHAALRKRPDSFTAYDLTLRALDTINSLDATRYRQAREYLRRAMAADPNFAMPVAWAAKWHSLNVGQGWSTNRREDSSTALELAGKAIELDRQNALALATYGHLKSYLFHDYDTALGYLERALTASPNSSLAWITSSPTLAYIGRGLEAVSHAEHALRLSPFDRELYYYHGIFCLAHFACGNYEQAVKWGRMSASANPGFTGNLRYLIAALVELGRVDEAAQFAHEMMRFEPQFRLSEWERSRQPFRDQVLKGKYVGALIRAGLPK